MFLVFTYRKGKVVFTFRRTGLLVSRLLLLSFNLWGMMTIKEKFAYGAIHHTIHVQSYYGLLEIFFKIVLVSALTPAQKIEIHIIHLFFI